MTTATETRHPGWCARQHCDAGMAHHTECRTIGDIHVWMLQSQARPHPRVFIGGVPVDARWAKALAHLLARLDHPELAAAVRHLGELHEAEQEAITERNRCHCGRAIVRAGSDGEWYHADRSSAPCDSARPRAAS